MVFVIATLTFDIVGSNKLHYDVFPRPVILFLQPILEGRGKGNIISYIEVQPGLQGWSSER